VFERTRCARDHTLPGFRGLRRPPVPSGVRNFTVSGAPPLRASFPNAFGRSIAVLGGVLYVGTKDSELYRLD